MAHFTIHQVEAIAARAQIKADRWALSNIYGARERSGAHFDIMLAAAAVQDCLAGLDGFETAEDDLWDALDGFYCDYSDFFPQVVA